MIKAVIFDMDGVISNTPILGAEIEREILSRYNINMTTEEIMKEVAGIPDPVQFEKIFSRFGVKADFEKLIDEKLEKAKERFKANPKPIKGVLDFINSISKEGLHLAVASSSQTDFISCVLEALGIKDKFKVIVSGYKLRRGKPYPDIFLLAAEKLHKEAEDCIVIEDAPAGITAAKSAGMKCIAITTTHARKELQEADKIIDSYSELGIEGSTILSL